MELSSKATATEAAAPRMDAVDSCILLRILMQDNEKQRILARSLILSGPDFYLDDTAIAEIVYVMTKNDYSREDIADSVWTLINNPIFVYDREFFIPVFELYRTHPSLSFEDCILAERTKQKKCGCIWTFDKKFANQIPVARRLG